MRSLHRTPFLLAAACLSLHSSLVLRPGLALAMTPALAGEAPAPPSAPSDSTARPQALKTLEAIMAGKPADPTPALYQFGAFYLEKGDWQAATPFIERLVQLRPLMFDAWELQVQASQAAGDLRGRDLAIRQLYTAWRSAPDAATRSRTLFTRDRIHGKSFTLLAQQVLEPSGDPLLRYLFRPADQGKGPVRAIVLRADSQTSEAWQQTMSVPEGTTIYYLAAAEQRPDGEEHVIYYRYFTELPDYDEVRSLVIAILNGSLQPTNGKADPFWTQ